jgi:hypothetical protein
MKKIIITCCVLFLGTVAFAQGSINNDLLVKFTKIELETIKKNSPTKYAYLEHCVKNAFYVAAMPEEKVKANPTKFKEIDVKLPITNFYELKIDVLENEYQSFVIKGTKKVLMVKSRTHILRELNK